jgi:Zn-dependent protease with chaperone function
MIQRIFWLAVFLFAVPIFGFIFAEGLIESMESRFVAVMMRLPTASSLSILDGTPCRALFERDLDRPCITYGHVMLLRNASIVIGLVSILMMAAIWGAAAYAKGSRDRLIMLFAPGMKVVIALLFFVIVGQAAVLTFGAFLAGFASTGRASVNLLRFIVPAGAGGVAAAYGMVVAAMAALKPEPSTEMAMELTREAQPRLWSFVDDIAQKLGAKPPQHIVCGLTPSFYATAWDVRLSGRGRVLQGETMYVSLPLMRVLAPQELACVIGHELGHFKGEDTAYSVKFVPIFAGTVSALQSLDGDNMKLLGLPAIAVLNVFLDSFSLAQSSISRQRELVADRAGVSVGSAEALGSSLVKVVALSHLWGNVVRQMTDLLKRDETFSNASGAFSSLAEGFTSKVDRAQLLSEIASERTAHPTDTHPALAERLEAIGLDLKDASGWLDITSEPAIGLIDGHETFEEALTRQLELQIDHYRRLPDHVRG